MKSAMRGYSEHIHYSQYKLREESFYSSIISHNELLQNNVLDNKIDLFNRKIKNYSQFLIHNS